MTPKTYRVAFALPSGAPDPRDRREIIARWIEKNGGVGVTVDSITSGVRDVWVPRWGGPGAGYAMRVNMSGGSVDKMGFEYALAAALDTDVYVMGVVEGAGPIPPDHDPVTVPDLLAPVGRLLYWAVVGILALAVLQVLALIMGGRRG